MLRKTERKEDKQESISEVDNDFLSQVLITHVPDWNPENVIIDFKACDTLLAKGANVNAKFGKHGMNDHDACSFCGPNDRPLTHAVKRAHAKLTEYLLKNGADTEVVNSDETPLMQSCFHSPGPSDAKHNIHITKLLLKHGANPNAKNRENLTAMHMIFLGLREWLVEGQRNPAAEAVKLLLDAGWVGSVEEIAAVLKQRGYTDPKIVNTFQQICIDVDMAARVEANNKEYDKLKQYIAENNIQPEKGQPSKIVNILRDQEAVKILELERLEKAKQQEAKQLTEVTKKIKMMRSILKEQAGKMSDAKSSVTYDPSEPFHKQAVKLITSGGDFNLLGIPYTNTTVYFKPVMIQGNEYFVSLHKETQVGSDKGVYIYNKLSFEVIDVASKKMFSNIGPEDIDSTLSKLHKDLDNGLDVTDEEMADSVFAIKRK